MIKFSIITCTYNAAKEVGRTLDSVLAQTYHHVEHLIIDGASKDATMQLVRAYERESEEAENDHELVVISEADSGLYDAMNKGIGMAKGDYVVFLNAGDVFPSPDTLELIAGSVGDGEALPGVLYGDTDIVDNAGRFLRHRRLAPPPEGLSWRSFSEGMLVCHQAFVARRDLAPHYDLKYRFSADFDWCIRVLQQSPVNVYAGDHPIISFLTDGLTSKYHRTSLMERYRIMCHYYGTCSTIAHHLMFIPRYLKRRFANSK